MGRSRSRSRDRRKRSRSRDRSRDRDRSSRYAEVQPPAAAAAAPAAAAQLQPLAQQLQAQQMAAQMQAQLQKQLLAQQLMMSAAAPVAASAPDANADRKRRELYVGNLAIGTIDGALLKEFFNQAFSHMVPDPIATPPVVNINMDPTGRFGFVEFRTEEMAEKGVEFDKIVDLGGRALNIGRPKGYFEYLAKTSGGGGMGAAAGQSFQQVLARHLGGGPTTVLLLSGLLLAGELRTADDRRILQEEVYEEAAKHGSVTGVCVPTPTELVQDLMPGRCYVRYNTVEDAQKGKTVFDGRTLDGHKIKVSFVPEEEYLRAGAGEWVPKHTGVAGIPLPGLYTMTPLPSGITGLTALNPTLAALVSNNPGVAHMMTAGINADEVPFERGWVKLRGFPPVVTKQDIIAVFKDCGNLTEANIKMVHSADGTSLGEAFVHFDDERSKVRLALAKDRSVIPSAGVPVEVLTSIQDDVTRRQYSGCVLI